MSHRTARDSVSRPEFGVSSLVGLDKLLDGILGESLPLHPLNCGPG